MGNQACAGEQLKIRLVAPTAALATGLLAPGASGAPGDLDPAFGEVGRVNHGLTSFGAIWAIDVDADDGILMGGVDGYCYYYCDYDTFAGWLEPDGGLDAAFAAAKLANAKVWDIAQQADGKAVAVGYRFAAGGGPIQLIAFRLRTDGTLDPSFGGTGVVQLAAPVGGYQRATSMALEPDGRITIAGSRAGNRLLVVRLLASGELDLAFGAGGYFIWETEINDGGSPRLVRLANGGYRVTVNTRRSAVDARNGCRVLALTASGALDTAFGSAGVSGEVVPAATLGQHCSSLVEQSDGRVLVGGSVVGTSSRGFVARLSVGGTLDPTFDASAVGQAMQGVTALAVGRDSIAVAGPDPSGLSGALVVRLQADGLLDMLFGRDGSTVVDLPAERETWPIVRDMEVLSDGAIVLGGTENMNWTFSGFVARLLGDAGGDSPGVLGIKSPTVALTEADGTATIVVRRAGGRDGAVGVRYTAEALPGESGSATAGSDFTPVQGRLTWADGNSADQTIAVPLVRDASGAESPEYFRVRLDSPDGAAGIGIATARVDIAGDAFPAGMFAISPVSPVPEGIGVVRIPVDRIDYSGGAVSVLATITPGSAEAGRDIEVAAPVRLSWPDGEMGTRYVFVPVLNDRRTEQAETFRVELSDASGGALISPDASVTVTINDDDPASGGGGGGRVSGLLALLSGLALYWRRRRGARPMA